MKWLKKFFKKEKWIEIKIPGINKEESEKEEDLAIEEPDKRQEEE